MKPQSAIERQENAHAEMATTLMAEGRKRKAAARRTSVTLMDFAEGRARILPRDEVMERLLARPRP